MARVGDAELLAIIELIYDAAVASERWQAVLDALGRTFDAKGVLYVYDTVTGATPLALMYGLEQRRLTEYLVHYAALNPYPQAAIPLAADRTIYAHDVVASDLVARSEFYNDYLRHEDFSLSHLCIKPIHDRERLAVITMSPNRQVFEAAPDAAFAAFDRLRPHITRALRLNAELGTRQVLGQTLAGRMAASGIATLLLDRQGRPVATNAPADDLLRRSTVITVDRFGAVVACHAPAQPRLQAMIARGAAAGLEACRLPDRDGDADATLVAWTVPLAGAVSGTLADANGMRDTASALGARGHTLLMLRPARRSMRVAPDVIASVFALSPAESRLVAALVQGRSLAEYAATSGLSERTTRNQMASVFEKTGTDRQHALVALVMATVLPLLPGGGD